MLVAEEVAMRWIVSCWLVCFAATGCSSTGSSSVAGLDAGPGDARTDAQTDGGTAGDASGGDGDGAVEAGCLAPNGAATTLSPTSTVALAVAGDLGSASGISDPSLVWPSGGAAGYLSYTTLEPSALFTRIAKTTDGRSFTYVVDANAYADLAVTTTDTTVCQATTCDGRLVHETSSIVEDPTDPDPARRFKLFDYSYVIVPGATPPQRNTWGYIGLYTAQTPEQGWSPGAKAVGWSSTAPGVSSDDAGTVISSVPALQDCAAFTEPAALVDSATGALYLALGCALQASSRVVLLRSTDHAVTFSYVGLLLGVADGTTLGSTSPGLMPSDLFQVGGATYLIVSTLGSTPVVADAPSGYTSCATVRIDDLASAAVQRDAQGNAVALRKIVAPGGTFAGACAFKPQFASGYLVDEVVADAGAPNEVFPSSLDCP
jgi:hypothetical protein